MNDLPQDFSVHNSNNESITLGQVADLLGKQSRLQVHFSTDKRSFQAIPSAKQKTEGILSATGEILQPAIISIKCELLRTSSGVRVNLQKFFESLAKFNSRVQIISPVKNAAGETSFRIELQIRANPMSMARQSSFSDELQNIAKIAQELQKELPELYRNEDLLNRYKDFENAIEPVFPQDREIVKKYPELQAWASDITDILFGSLSVALVSDDYLQTSYLLSFLSTVIPNSTLGRIKFPSISSSGLVDLVEKAPGHLTLSVPRLQIATNPYQMGDEVQTLLSVISAKGKAVIFSGSLAQLQAVFHGGQGGMSDPLMPVVSHPPQIPLAPLIEFEIQARSMEVGGLPKKTKENISKYILNSLADVRASTQMRFLSPLISREIKNRTSGRKQDVSESAIYLSKMEKLTETLAGLNTESRAARSPLVQNRFTQKLTGSGLVGFFKSELLAQDEALENLAARLHSEVLTRPLHQPIRYFCQGTPSTGKSQSAVLLARFLNIPFLNIDAASLPDYYTASSQLLGSARGIVGSHKSGRLEQAAKHHTGAVVEISDLDHAVPSVRSVFADLFLQVLETGEAQSSTGAMFSCANLIFAFTINLPGGLDEEIRRGFGFNNSPGSSEIKKRVVSEIKNMFSTAFLSRIGDPILFAPLEGEALEKIIENELSKSSRTAFERMNMGIREIKMEKELGRNVLAGYAGNITVLGARALLEYARHLVSRAVLNFFREKKSYPGGVLRISFTEDHSLQFSFS